MTDDNPSICDECGDAIDEDDGDTCECGAHCCYECLSEGGLHKCEQPADSGATP